MRKPIKLSYRFTVLALSILIMTVAFGVQSTFGVFFKPMSGKFGWDRAATSGPFALYLVVYGIFCIIVGRLSDRIAVWKLVSAGTIVLGMGYLLMSTISSLWQLYLYYGVIVAVGLSTMYVPLVAIVARWFGKNRGLMSGVAISGIGFGIGLVPPLASHLIVSFHWRTAMVCLGSGVIVLILILAQFLRKIPQADTTPAEISVTKKVGSVAVKSYTLSEALRLPQFWMIFIAWALFGFFYQMPIVHIVPYATDLKMSAVEAATIMTTIGLVGIPGRIGLGYISDKLTNRVTAGISFTVIGLSFVGLALVHSVWMLYVFAVIFGLLFGIGVLLVPVVAEYFGFKELGLITGIVIFASSLGGAISPPLAGFIYDKLGNYTLAFVICAVAGITGGLTVWLLKPTSTNQTSVRY
jgi:MFS transporter, OFA family, oxalate/formate antiporter